MRFEEKVVLVTGGGSGIGRQAALAFAQEGAKVVVADVNDVGGEETIQQILAEGGTASYVHADVTDSAAVKAMVDLAVMRYGGLDVAVNNAGVSGGETVYFQDAAEETYDRVMNINTKGVWLCMKHELPIMLKQGSGAIVNIASVAGLLGLPGDAIYTASKHAVVGLTRAAAAEVARKHIRINAVCPGYTETPLFTDLVDQRPGVQATMLNFIPMRRFGKPEEIAEGILWLAEESNSFVTGIALPMDGGISSW